RLPSKKWGVYSHRIARNDHPLMRDINTRFDAPHSRFNEVRKEDLEDAGVVVLAESADAGVHLAVSPDRFRIVYFQGHPEYNGNSLLKEYKREVNRYLGGETGVEPPFPENYFSKEAKDIAGRFMADAKSAALAGTRGPAFPEAELESLVDNTWGDTGKSIVNNWLGLVYQTTNLDRKLQFMPDVDPEDPLLLCSRKTQGDAVELREEAM
ncbi:MAG: homoserine O-succinyltransferase, partial [Woeseiaceae bacterium]